MDVIGYLRVSTDRQAEEGLGLEIQREAIERWASEHGHQIVSWCSDEGISGSNGLDCRIGLADALDGLREGIAKGIVVYKLDRLARDLVLQEQLLADIRRSGADLFSTSAAEAAFLRDDPDDPSRTLIRQILGAVSAYERAMIALRMRSGRRRKKEKGLYAGGAPAFGYVPEARELVAVDVEQDAIARMHVLRDAGLSLRQIVVALEAENVATKRDGRWHAKTVRDILVRSAR